MEKGCFETVGVEENVTSMRESIVGSIIYHMSLVWFIGPLMSVF